MHRIENEEKKNDGGGRDNHGGGGGGHGNGGNHKNSMMESHTLSQGSYTGTGDHTSNLMKQIKAK